MAPSLEHFQPKWMPVRRRKCDPHEASIFSRSGCRFGVENATRVKSKPYKQTGERSPAPPIQTTF